MRTILAIVFLALTATAQTNFFPKLLADDGLVIMTNAEFRSVVGRKIIFRQSDTGKLKSIDIETVSTEIRDSLKINSAEAMENQRKIDEQKLNAERIRAEQVVFLKGQQRIRAAEMEKINSEKAKIAAIQSERDEQKRKENELHQLSVEQKKADIEETKAMTRSFNRSP